MDILLAHGYFLNHDPKEQQIMRPYPPLGLLCLSAYLKEKGFAVEVFDSTFGEMADYAGILAAKKPPVVGLYANMMTKFQILEMIELAKAQDARVILGGPDPPYYAEEYLHHGADIIVLGEGEKALEELLQIAAGDRRAWQQVAGIVYRDEHGRVQRTPSRQLISDLDVLPFPDREAIDLHAYLRVWRQHHGMSMVSLITARGCPFTCTWCSHSVYGRTFRKRSVQSVADEVEAIVADYAPDMLWYADDVFNIQQKWLFNFAGELQRRRLQIPFECICRADLLNEEVIKTLRRMGCERVWIGSESGSQRLLDLMKRGVKVEQVQAMTRMAKKHGIETGMFLMWGFEDETRGDIEATIAHVKRANPDLVLTTTAYPIKGTEYYQRMVSQKRLVTPHDWRGTNDRDHQIKGRHAKRYYDFANRRLYAELARTRLAENGGGHPLRRLKAKIDAEVGRIGMAVTSFQREA